MIRLSLLVPVCMALLAACAAPQGRDARRDALTPLRDDFDAADLDGDGVLTRDETAAGLPKLSPQFDAIDTDGNGQISAAELRSFLEWRRILAQPPPGGRERMR